ncbi:unnamed protein product [Ixodes pacificus]
MPECTAAALNADPRLLQPTATPHSPRPGAAVSGECAEATCSPNATRRSTLPGDPTLPGVQECAGDHVPPGQDSTRPGADRAGSPALESTSDATASIQPASDQARNRQPDTLPLPPMMDPARSLPKWEPVDVVLRQVAAVVFQSLGLPPYGLCMIQKTLCSLQA